MTAAGSVPVDANQGSRRHELPQKHRTGRANQKHRERENDSQCKAELPDQTHRFLLPHIATVSSQMERRRPPLQPRHISRAHFGRRLALVTASQLPKSLPVLDGINEGLDHLCSIVVTIELNQFLQPEIVAAIVYVLPGVGIPT